MSTSINDRGYLETYKKLMDMYRESVHFTSCKSTYCLPFYLNILKYYLRSGNYKEAVNSLKDVVLCYDMSDPRINYITKDALEECEKYVDELIEAQQ